VAIKPENLDFGVTLFEFIMKVPKGQLAPSLSFCPFKVDHKNDQP